MTETATATNPTEATATPDASATLLATAGNETGDSQQTQNAGAQPAAAAETSGEAKPEAEPSAASGAPEKYEFKAPEGSEYDPEILESFSGAAKEAGLTQDAAQKLIEKMAPALAARQVDQVNAIHEDWRQSALSDKEFGGEKLTENLAVARKALDQFATPELRTLLDETGLGNHPEVIRMLYRTGKAISEDKFVGGASAGTGKADPTAVLYDRTPQKS